MPRPCAAYGCTTNCSRVHAMFRFPRDKNRCKIWTERASNKDLMGLDSKYLNIAAKLCARHFARSEFTNDRVNRLVWNAVPSIFDHDFNLQLPDPTDKEDIVLDLPLVSKYFQSITVDRPIPFFNEYLPIPPVNEVISPLTEDISPLKKEILHSHTTPLEYSVNLVDSVACQESYSPIFESSDLSAVPTTSNRLLAIIPEENSYLKHTCLVSRGSTSLNTTLTPTRQPTTAIEPFTPPAEIGLNLDQLMQSSYSADINLAHGVLAVKQEQQPNADINLAHSVLAVKQEQQPDADINLAHGVLAVKQEQQPDVGFVDVDSDQLQPLELPQVPGQDVDPLMLPGTFQAWNTVSPYVPSLSEPHHFKQELLDNMKRESPEMKFPPMTYHGTQH